MRTVLTALMLLALGGCATVDTSRSPLHPSTAIDAARFYSGTWYEIGRRPMKLTNGCVAGGTTYTRQGGNKVAGADQSTTPDQSGSEPSCAVATRRGSSPSRVTR